MKIIANYAFTLLLWAAAIRLWAKRAWPYFFWLLLGLHGIELVLVGFKTGRQYGVSGPKSILMCLLFGYNWWLPLRRQMDAETFSAADFVREG